ncbi:MAG: cupin domain-containing protein [Gammaproteobacteria bacterium]|nr:cupin domain-containing protein [Gammaproteobacteria bacterium]
MLENEYLENRVNRIIEENNLRKHPEGGYYIQIYKSPNKIAVSSRYKGDRTRPEFTKINYFLIGNDFSAWHKVASDEIWRFKEDSSLTLHIIDHNANLAQVKIGNPNEEIDAVSEFLVGHSQWFAASVNDKHLFSFVECEVRPGFMFDDFELGIKEGLIKTYPNHRAIIEKYSVVDKIEIPNQSHSILSA